MQSDGVNILYRLHKYKIMNKTILFLNWMKHFISTNDFGQLSFYFGLTEKYH